MQDKIQIHYAGDLVQVVKDDVQWCEHGSFIDGPALACEACKNTHLRVIYDRKIQAVHLVCPDCERYTGAIAVAERPLCPNTARELIEGK